MTVDALFCSLSPDRVADLVRSAQHAVCYAAPGIQLDLAQAMVETAGRLGKEMLTVSLDFDDRVMRMGYGDIGAVTMLLDAGIPQRGLGQSVFRVQGGGAKRVRRTESQVASINLSGKVASSIKNTR
jgi:hypothetical protein